MGVFVGGKEYTPRELLVREIRIELDQEEKMPHGEEDGLNKRLFLGINPSLLRLVTGITQEDIESSAPSEIHALIHEVVRVNAIFFGLWAGIQDQKKYPPLNSTMPSVP
ncbi:MAG: hypothetical protein HQL73_02765 [Magnetococcales bacterium]|nr:hypothetical protein [Magnetococcales bacterium]